MHMTIIEIAVFAALLSGAQITLVAASTLGLALSRETLAEPI